MRPKVRKKRLAVISVSVPDLQYPWLVNDPIPKTLADGESANWQIPLTQEDDWIDDLVDSKLVQTWLDVETFRFSIHTAHGKTLLIQPEYPFREQLHDRIRAKMQSGKS